MKLLEAVEAGFFVNKDINLIDDFEFAYLFEKRIDRMLNAMDADDVLGELQAEREARELYHEQ